MEDRRCKGERNGRFGDLGERSMGERGERGEGETDDDVTFRTRRESTERESNTVRSGSGTEGEVEGETGVILLAWLL
jgi:hypothetical protein